MQRLLCPTARLGDRCATAGHCDHRTTRRCATNQSESRLGHRALLVWTSRLCPARRSRDCPFASEHKPRDANQASRTRLLRNGTSTALTGRLAAASRYAAGGCLVVVSADRFEVAAAVSARALDPDPALQLHRTHLRRDPPPSQGHRPPPGQALLRVAGMGGAGSCLPASVGSPSPPPGCGYWPTCAIHCTTHQPTSANRTQHTTPKNRDSANRFRRDRITSPRQTSGTYIKPLLHRKWAPPCDIGMRRRRFAGRRARM